ncbi:MAG: IS110 family transposase [Kiloniellales bacterium]|nr:IS110 family transposase [Kiloniellales bacterium]
MKNTKHSRKAAGIDTGKHKLDIAIHGSQARLEVANDVAGHERLIDWLKAQKVKRVGIEASGGYEKAVVAALRRAKLRVIVFQPKQVRCLAGFQLLRAKNDRIDAALIAKCASFYQDVRPAPDPRLQDLAEQLTLIDQLSEDIARWKTRLEGCRQAERRGWIGEEIKRLTRIRDLERKRLLRSVKSHQDLAQRYNLILSVEGIGMPTALTLLIRLPELGSLTREQVAALAGLAPFDHDSGRFQGQRRIAGGRSKVRKALYAAAFPAAQQWNPQLVALYKRLKDDGKEHKKALIACARKLLIMVNAVVTRGTPWIKSQAVA